MLFPSGSWTVNKNGKKALDQLAAVLAENPELNVTVEGHTDSDPFNGSGAVKDNWDLSVMRATAIVKILTDNAGVVPKRITAAGRSEFVPIATNETKDGKAKNRRTEIIITPDMSQIVKVLGEVNE
ncbi:MAG: OmpA family protein [Owenweeksia sp.]|nr:OmpA family protein [Owenweeksia sp.]